MLTYAICFRTAAGTLNILFVQLYSTIASIFSERVFWTGIGFYKSRKGSRVPSTVTKLSLRVLRELTLWMPEHLEGTLAMATRATLPRRYLATSKHERICS